MTLILTTLPYLLRHDYFLVKRLWFVLCQKSAHNKIMEEPTSAEETPQALTWQASEYLHHQKQFGWYALLALGAMGLMILAAITKQWLSIGVFAAMGLALGVYAGKSPRVLSYRLDEKGLTIGDKFHPYDRFRSFGVIEDVAWHSIDLEPTQRFMPRLSIMFDSQHFDQIVEILTRQLPRQDRQPDWAERLSRRLKF